MQSGSKLSVEEEVLLWRVALLLLLLMCELRGHHALDPIRPMLLKSLEGAIRYERDGHK